MSTNCRADSRQADLESTNGRAGLDKRAGQLPDADTPVEEDEVAGAVDGQLPGGDDHRGLDRDPGGRVEAASERRMDGRVVSFLSQLFWLSPDPYLWHLSFLIYVFD